MVKSKKSMSYYKNYSFEDLLIEIIGTKVIFGYNGLNKYSREYTVSFLKKMDKRVGQKVTIIAENSYGKWITIKFKDGFIIIVPYYSLTDKSKLWWLVREKIGDENN